MNAYFTRGYIRELVREWWENKIALRRSAGLYDVCANLRARQRLIERTVLDK